MIITVGSVVKDGEGNTYKLTNDIGQGGFGCVYKAVREMDGRVFAVKTLLNSFTDNDAVLSFKNEIALAEQVRGENIIEYIYVHNGEKYLDFPPYIIMEYADGGTLRGQIKERKNLDSPYTPEELLEIYRQLIEGMKIINSKLVHRDIKPENILISNNKYKLSDFGLGKIVTDSTRTKSFKGYGTIPYIAPEAWNNQKNTIQMDIYSMGIVFYELATFKYPYEIREENYEEYKNAHLYSPIKDISLLQSRTSPIIASAIKRMMEKPTQMRFNNWDEILEHVCKEVKSGSVLSSIVLSTISENNRRETLRQQQIENENRNKQEKADFCKLVKTQFESTILSKLNEFVEQYNLSSSSVDKCVLRSKSRNRETFSYDMNVPNIAEIKIEGKVVFPNSETREQRAVFSDRLITTNYTPQFADRDVIGWFEVENALDFGFNLMLVKSDELYGDWYIVKNTNNLNCLSKDERERKEPFAFSVYSLSEALKSMSCISLYRSEAIPFEEKEFLKYFLKLLKL